MLEKLISKYKKQLPNNNVVIYDSYTPKYTKLYDCLTSMLTDMLSEGEDIFLEDKRLQSDLSLLNTLTGFRNVYEKWYQDKKLVIDKEFSEVSVPTDLIELKYKIVTTNELALLIANKILAETDTNDVYNMIVEGVKGLDSYSKKELKEQYYDYFGYKQKVIINDSKENNKVNISSFDSNFKDKAISIILLATIPINHTHFSPNNELKKFSNKSINKEEALTIIEEYKNLAITKINNTLLIETYEN